MTIVFGMLQSNSIVMTADTEVTGEHLKWSAPKLYSYTRDNGERLVIGGSGSSFSVSTMEQQLGKSFLDDSASFEGIAQMLIKQFYAEHVTAHDDPYDRQDFSLLIGCSLRSGDGWEHRLWISEHGSLRDTERFAAIGMGADVAGTLLGRYQGFYPLAVAEFIAVHILRLVKKQAQYCGMDSMVWSVRGPDIRKMPEEYVHRCDGMSRRFDKLSDKAFMGLFTDVIGSAGERGGEGMLQHVYSGLKSLRDEYTKLFDDLDTIYSLEEDFDGSKLSPPAPCE